jgi:hypothetical protein
MKNLKFLMFTLIVTSSLFAQGAELTARFVFTKDLTCTTKYPNVTFDIRSGTTPGGTILYANSAGKIFYSYNQLAVTVRNKYSIEQETEDYHLFLKGDALEYVLKKGWSFVNLTGW